MDKLYLSQFDKDVFKTSSKQLSRVILLILLILIYKMQVTICRWSKAIGRSIIMIECGNMTYLCTMDSIWLQFAPYLQAFNIHVFWGISSNRHQSNWIRVGTSDLLWLRYNLYTGNLLRKKPTKAITINDTIHIYESIYIFTYMYVVFYKIILFIRRVYEPQVQLRWKSGKIKQ